MTATTASKAAPRKAVPPPPIVLPTTEVTGATHDPFAVDPLVEVAKLEERVTVLERELLELLARVAELGSVSAPEILTDDAPAPVADPHDYPICPEHWPAGWPEGQEATACGHGAWFRGDAPVLTEAGALAAGLAAPDAPQVELIGDPFAEDVDMIL